MDSQKYIIYQFFEQLSLVPIGMRLVLSFYI